MGCKSSKVVDATVINFDFFRAANECGDNFNGYKNPPDFTSSILRKSIYEEFMKKLEEDSGFVLPKGAFIEIRFILNDGSVTPFRLFEKGDHLTDLIISGAMKMEVRDPSNGDRLSESKKKRGRPKSENM